MKLIITFLLVLTTFSFGQDFWEQTNGPNNNGSISCLAINSNGDIFAGTWGEGIFRSIDNGDNWTTINSGFTSLDISFLTITPNGDIYAGIHKNGDDSFFRSTDSGDSWTEKNNGLTNLNIRCLVMNSNEDIFVGTDGGGIFRSTDNGDSWTDINNGLKEEFGYGSVESLAINSSGHIFAACYSEGIFRSKDNGENWIPINEGIPLEGSYPISSAINSSGDIFAGFDTFFIGHGGVYCSTDNGNTWANSGLEGTAITSFVFNSNGDIFARVMEEPPNVEGVYCSRDNGDTWQKINEGLPSPEHVNCLATNSRGYLFAGTRYGLYRSINTTVSVESKDNIPTTYFLEQNYPNPFNPSTTISYSIPKQSMVSLKVFDVLGREIEILINKKQPQGNYEVEFEATNLTSGIYFYRIQAGEFVDTKKMILLR